MKKQSKKLAEAEAKYMKILAAHKKAQEVFLALNRKLAKAGDSVRKAYLKK
jgi:hypothetical protein